MSKKPTLPNMEGYLLGLCEYGPAEPLPSRYKPNGTPLSDHERELLVILMEECAEVTQAASKLLRFGKENRPDTGVSNSDVLATEMGDLDAVSVMVSEAGLVNRDVVNGASHNKRAKLGYFMQSSLATGDQTK